MRQYQKVIYLSCEWSYIETLQDGKLLLRSTNKNLHNVVADSKYVKILKTNR